MYNFANFCIVCFSCNEKLKRLSDTDRDNIRFLEKLECCSGKKVYENVPHFICNECCNDLSRVYNFKKKVLASRKYLKSYLLKFLKHSDNNKYCCNVYVSLVDIRRSRNLSNYVKHHVNNDVEIYDEESQNYSPETRRSCDENKETASYTKKIFNDENRKTLTEMIHTYVENKKERNEQERLIKQENLEIEIEEHNVDTNKYIVDKVNKKIKLEVGEKNIEVQPTWILKSVLSVDKNKQEKNNTETEKHMALNRCRREKLNEKTSDENRNNYDVLRKEEENPFSCEKCLQRRTTKEELEKHMLQMHRNNYSCEVCQKDFSKQEKLQRHMRMHTGEKPFQCTICSKRFKTKYNVKQHMMIHNNEKPFSCHICNKKSRSRSDLRKHVRLHEDPEYKAQKYTCIFDNAVTMYEESKSETVEDFGDKELAEEEVIDISEISVNEKTSDENTNSYDVLREEEENPFSCEMCPQRCTMREELEKHMLLHGNKESDDLREHLQMHGKYYSCKVCQKDFSAPAKLQRHMRVHTGEKPFQCPNCSQRFRAKYNLKQHMMIHNNEKPFSCHICNKQFRCKSDLRKHVRRHEDPGYTTQTYTCSACKRDFNYKASLTRHMRVHTGEKPFECTICSKRFTTNGSVKAHMVVHTNEKPFSCHICNKQFRHKGTLRKHVRQHGDPKSSTATKNISKNSELDVMESKNRTHIVKTIMQKYLRKNTNSTELIVGVPLNETDEDVADESVARTVEKIEEANQDMIEAAKLSNEFNKPLKINEEKHETEQCKFETVFVCC